MKILLVEDDGNKRAQVAEFLSKQQSSECIDEARSYNSAIRFLSEKVVDLVVLDMSLPLFDQSAEEDGFQDDAFGGMEVLAFARRRNLTTRFVVLTQFDTLGEGESMIGINELGAKLREEFGPSYLGIVYYSPAEASWREELKRYLYDYSPDN
jgi:DNA-binding NarL/FixJ family response regulator